MSRLSLTRHGSLFSMQSCLCCRCPYCEIICAIISLVAFGEVPAIITVIIIDQERGSCSYICSSPAQVILGIEIHFSAILDSVIPVAIGAAFLPVGVILVVFRLINLEIG